ncbi:MAG: uracil-DNA glycosylase [Elusimicrobia bacterium]|nr:uracil-DNA glycosylase [Elusimicrobiota bacterium]
MGFDAIPRVEKSPRESRPPAPINSPQEFASKGKLLEELREKYASCRNCPLSASRTKIVFGEGNPSARLMFIGEGPGFDEDHTGRPFVGRAGQLLTKILVKGMKLKRSDVYITNIVKCHPMKDPTNPEKRGNDRPPNFFEVSKCIPILYEQIKIIRPEVICALGGPAAKILLATEAGISSLRGKVFERKIIPSEPDFIVKIVPTFHPAYLLRNPPAKVPAWKDYQEIMKILGLKRSD